MLLAEDRRQKVNISAAWNGTGTAPTGSVVNISAAAGSVLGVQVSGTFTATLQFEGRIAETDDVNDWFAITGIPAAGGVGVTNATAAGRWFFQYAGLRAARVRCSAYTSGTPVVTMNVSAGAPTGAGGSGASGAVTIVDGGDVAEGTTTDAGIITDTNGTVIGFLRGAIIQWAKNLTQLGIVTEAAPATDTASSGLNGRLQRIAQRLTSLIALVPAALTGSGNFKVAVAESTATVTAQGTLTNNNAAPGANNTGVLPAIANAASPTYTEGDQVLLSTDLTGLMRAKVAGFQASGTAVASNPILVGLNGSGALVRYAVDAVAGFPTTGTGVTAVHHGVFDGTNFQKSLQVTQATGNTGVGLPAAGPLLWDLVGTTNFVKQAGDGSGRAMMVGAAATGAAVAGNPILTGGSDGTNAQPIKVDTTGRPILTGQMAAGQAASGANPVMIGFSDGSNNNQPLRGSAPSDALTNGFNALITNTFMEVFNGTTWDRQRNNVEVTLLASAGRTTTQVSAAITTYNAGAIMVILDMTTVGTGSVTVSIDGVEAVSGNLYNLLTGAAVVTNVRNVYVVDPTIPAVANVSAQKRLPRTIKITVTANNANSAVYSVSYVLQPC